MKFDLTCWLAVGVAFGALTGFSVGKGDPQAPMVVGAVGGGLGFAGFCVVQAVHKLLKIETSRTDHAAIVGSFVGAICGGAIGAFSSFGKVMILIFNPDLPERDWGGFFGATGGIILGAFFGSCVASAVVPIFLHIRRLPRESTVNDNYDANDM